MCLVACGVVCLFPKSKTIKLNLIPTIFSNKRTTIVYAFRQQISLIVTDNMSEVSRNINPESHKNKQACAENIIQEQKSTT